MKGETSLSLTQSPETPYCFAAAIVEGHLWTSSVHGSKEEAEQEIMDNDLAKTSEYRVYYTRYRNIQPSKRILDQLSKDLG